MYEPVRVSGWQQLAEELLEALGDEVAEQGTPVWIRVFEGGEAGPCMEVTSEPLAFLGWTAPPECVAVGVVATGRLSADPCAGAGAVRPGGGGRMADVYQDLAPVGGARVRLCCIVGRCGEVGWRLEGPDGASSTSAPEAGRLLDCLKRCVGLATPPPAQPASVVHAAAWAASVLEAAMEAPRPLTWSDVSRLHPLARLLAGDLVRSGEAPAGAGGVEELADLLRIAANAWSWAEIREQAADGSLGGIIDARMAAWMDDGMFSRWLLSLVPPMEQLVAAVRSYLVPSAAKRFGEALRAGA